VPEATETGIGQREVTQLSALNETLREDYTIDCQKGIERWNRALAEAGTGFELRLPHIGFHRQVGTFAGHHISPDGEMISAAEWKTNEDRWLPSTADTEHVKSLMVGVTEPGRMAGWISPPAAGVNQKPVDYEYVQI